MRVYTKIGDRGRTTFFGCGMVAKNDPRIELFGALDELNSTIGVAIAFVEDEALAALLKKIQNDLFQVGADVGGSLLSEEKAPRIHAAHIDELESMIDKIDEALEIPKSFILPGGTRTSAYLHLCRAVTRRAERSLVSVREVLDINPELLRYVNRLSDFFFVLARQANEEMKIKEQQPIYKYFEE